MTQSFVHEPVVQGPVIPEPAAPVLPPAFRCVLAPATDDAFSRASALAEDEAGNAAGTLELVERGDIELKKIGLEVVVRVAGQKRTIILPPSLAEYETSGARFADGALEVDFERATDGSGAADTE